MLKLIDPMTSLDSSLAPLVGHINLNHDSQVHNKNIIGHKNLNLDALSLWMHVVISIIYMDMTINGCNFFGPFHLQESILGLLVILFILF